MDTVTDVPRIAEILAKCTLADDLEKDLVAELAITHALVIRGLHASPNLDGGGAVHHQCEAIVNDLVRLRLSDLHPATGTPDALSSEQSWIWATQLGEALYEATQYLIHHIQDHAHAVFFMGFAFTEPFIMRGEYERYHRRIAEIFSDETIIVDVIDQGDAEQIAA